MTYVKNQAPYYDGFDEEKDFSQVLFIPGVSLQSREFNEVQSILQNSIKQLGDSILTDGDIIEGCQLIIPDSNTIQKECTITSGKLYLNGMVRNLQQSVVTIQGSGVETIGVKLNQEVITSITDDALVDPAIGFANYRQSGAHRLKETVVVSVNDSTASTLFTLQNGELVNNAVNTSDTVIDKINSTLARRTYDESGNYKVWGLEMSAKPITVIDDNYLYVSMSAGKAYVKGVEVVKQSSTTIALERAKDLRDVKNEPKVFATGTNLYSLNNIPVDSITDLVATISVTMQMTRGSIANGSDPIPEIYRPAVDIQSITQVASGTTYVKNQDFILQSDTINWSLAGNEPSAGESYTVTFTYNKTMVANDDYDLYYSDGVYYIRLLKGYSETPTSDPNGNIINGIVNSSTMLVNYKFMLYYTAVITLDTNGNFRIVRGQSDTLEVVSLPDMNDQEVLVMGSILLSPKNDNLSISNNKNTRLSMTELQYMVQRLYDLEYNQAVTNLDNEAMYGENPTLLKGIYTDGFVGFTKCDINYENTSLGLEFKAAIDTDNNELTLSSTNTVHDLTTSIRTDLLPASSSTNFGRVSTGKATETLTAYQPYATGVHLINPYKVFPDSPIMSVSPSVDNWIDTNNIIVSGGTIITQNITRRTIHSSGRNSSTTILSESSTSNYTEKLLESAIIYMRSHVVSVVGKKFGSHRPNITLKFNGLPVSYTPNINCQDENGKLKSNAAGEVLCTFIVPANTLCGTVKVELYPEDAPNFSATTYYSASGTLKSRITTITTNVFREVLQVYDADPLAQTFEFDKDQIISSIGLYFCTSDTSEGVVVQVKNVENGYPGSVCYAEKFLAASECLVSEKGTIETRVAFDNPVYCKADTQYCFVVLTESSTASLYYSQLGGKDLNTKVQVIKNPYIPGVMFSSSNAKTWTAHQASNLKFNIYGNTFQNVSYLYFNEILNVRYDRLCLLADTEVPVDTYLTWEYSKDSGVTWYPIAINQDVELSSLITKILVRACFKSQTNVSPALAIDSVVLVGYLNDTECNYIMKSITTDSPYTKVKQVVDIYAPTGTMCTIYYSTNNTTWSAATQTGSKIKDASGVIQYTFEATLAEAVTSFRARVLMTTNNPCIRPRIKNLMNILK